jgi:hypothetical protein
MIVERLLFRTQFGKGDEVAAAFCEWRDKHASRWGVRTRVLVDVTGPMFMVVVENEYADLEAVASVQKLMQADFASPEFAAWFPKWAGITESGTRELYRVVD